MQQYNFPTTIYFGDDALESLARAIKGKGHQKMLLVTDRTLTSLGLAKQVADVLRLKWDTVYRAARSVGNDGLAQRDLPGNTTIGVERAPSIRKPWLSKSSASSQPAAFAARRPMAAEGWALSLAPPQG